MIYRPGVRFSENDVPVIPMTWWIQIDIHLFY